MHTEQKNAVLTSLFRLINKNINGILNANQQDLLLAGQLDESLSDRLKLNENKIKGMTEAIQSAIVQEDPELKTTYSFTHSNGLHIKNKLVPFGKILIIYESRPDVTIEASIVAFKAGNKILLKGGKESRTTNLFLAGLWQQALTENQQTGDWVEYLDYNREETMNLIRSNTKKVDLIIPRGGEALIQFVTQNTTIPVIVSGRGNNFLYIDKSCNADMAIELILNGKSRISVCNALDKVLIHQHHLIDKRFIQELYQSLTDKSIEIMMDNKIADLLNVKPTALTDEIWKEEFLASKIVLASIKSLDAAVSHINRYSGGHSACIVTNNTLHADHFQKEVDCAAVYHNASTRFTDGGQFGFGAEMAISTQKLHFRGPIGIEQLVTNKWFIKGNGQTR